VSVTADTVRAVVEAGGDEAARLMIRLERRLESLATGHGAELGRHAAHTIAAGGKRLRPLLVFLSAGAPPPESDALLRSAVSIELVHSATLVHDDVLDGSALRRGRPTIIAAGGRLAATATGDLLFSRAFAELVASRSADAVRVLARASRKLAAGELMQRADAWTVVAPERCLERSRMKTAALFAAACELGALEARGDRPALAAGGNGPALAAFGERIGLAFQLLDDVLDVAGPPERTGKPRGADLLDGTVNLPLIVALERDERLRGLDVRSIASAGDAAHVCDLIAATGALEEVRARAAALVADAKSELPRLPARQRAALELIADGVVERYS